MSIGKPPGFSHSILHHQQRLTHIQTLVESVTQHVSVELLHINCISLNQLYFHVGDSRGSIETSKVVVILSTLTEATDCKCHWQIAVSYFWVKLDKAEVYESSLRFSLHICAEMSCRNSSSKKVCWPVVTSLSHLEPITKHQYIDGSKCLNVLLCKHTACFIEHVLSAWILSGLKSFYLQHSIIAVLTLQFHIWITAPFICVMA